jgi:hypothetical protein
VKRLFTVLILFVAGSAHAQTEWRTFAGGFSSRWKTIGAHGHDQPLCAPIKITYFHQATLHEYPDCNSHDFARGNLDNSIGFRAGRERDFVGLGPLKVVGGAEGSVSYTEYNITQMDLSIFTGAVTGGLDLAAFGTRLGARIGGGPYATSDGREYGLQLFHEFSATVPFRSGAALRFTRRTSRTNDVHLRAAENAIMFVGDPTGDIESKWELGSWAGATSPGFGPGDSAELRKTAFHRLSLFRDIPWRETQLQASWTSTAHESRLPSKFFGYDGNYRSKTVNGFGIGLRRKAMWFRPLTLHYGAGLELADWRDDHELLKGAPSRVREAGVEMAVTGNTGIQLHLAHNLALELTAEHAYWHAINVGELRWGFGIVLTK